MLESVTSLLIQHDLVTVFVVVLLATLGIPIPALPVLLLVGAQAAGDGRFRFEALGLATLASTLSAATWYAAGRRLGRRVLAFLCRISISPDTCVRKNEASFAKRGALTLVIAKFVSAHRRTLGDELPAAADAQVEGSVPGRLMPP